MQKFILILTFIALTLLVNITLLGQDERIKLMTYNILNFPSSSNTVDNANRANSFAQIVESAGADAIVVQELKSSAGADLLLNELNNNTSGITYAKAPVYTGYGGLGNMLFYNSSKLGFISQTEIPQVNLDVIGSSDNANPRPPSHYRLYVQDPTLPFHLDTIYLDLISVHLKASSSNGGGNTIPDRERRLNGVQDIMDYIVTLPSDRNILIGGDFNFYDDDYGTDSDGNGYTEPGYGELITNGFVDVVGPWIRETMSYLHVFSQSTRSSTSSTTLTYTNGGASGGFDDRFDLWFMDGNVFTNTNHIEYVNNSYQTFGNPGILDGSVLDGTHPLKNELHQMSDHYPVCLELDVFYPQNCAIVPTLNSVNTNCIAGLGSGEISINASISNGNTLEYSIDGTNFQTSNVFSNLANGNYTVYVKDQMFNCLTNQSNINIGCSDVCAISQINVHQNCTGNTNGYTIDIDFNAINLNGNIVNIKIDGTTYGPYAVSGTSPNYTVTIPSNDFTGDASDLETNVLIEVEDPNTLSSANSVVLLNEVMINADGSGSTTDNGSGEWFELFCAGPGPCDLSCYLVGDDDYAFIIPNGTVLQAGEFYVLHGDNLSNGNGGPLPAGTAFFNWDDNLNATSIVSLAGSSSVGGLTNSGEQAYIWDTQGNVIDGVIWDDGSTNLGNTYMVTLPASCGGGTLSLSQSTSVKTVANDGGGDALPIHLSTTGNWATNSVSPSPGSNNISQYPIDTSPTSSQCVAMTTYDEQTCGPITAVSSVSLRVLLEGPFDSSTGQMHNELNLQNLLPNQHPYNVAPYNYTGGTSLTSFPPQMVDWVLVEARTNTMNTSRVEMKVGILLQDGRITAVDGTSPLSFNLTVGSSYYFVVRHRNHLDVMTANPVIQSSLMTYDFTTAAAQAFGNNQQKIIGNKAVLFGGDMTQDLVIQITDFDAWRMQPAQISVYTPIDANMDGIVQTTDADLWFFNQAKLAPIELNY